MIRLMTIDDYEDLIEIWKQTPNMGLRSLDDSKEGITIKDFLGFYCKSITDKENLPLFKI